LKLFKECDRKETEDMSRIFIIMGKSATGKDTIFKKLVERKELNLKTVVSYTTRPIRKGEKDGVEYYFVNEEKLYNLIQENKVIEHRSYNTIHGVWNYFTVDDGQIDLDTGNYIMVNTLEAYEQIQKYYGSETVVPLYIEVDDKIRLHRALEREDKENSPKYAELCRRYLADEEDFSKKNILEIGINRRYKNNDVNNCVHNIMNDIKLLCN
jgi:guanylate kinase